MTTSRITDTPPPEDDGFSFDVALPGVTFIGMQIGDEMDISAHGGDYSGACASFSVEELQSGLPLLIAPPVLLAREGRRITVRPGLYAATADIEFLARWYRDGVEIPDATGPGYTLRSPEDDGAGIEYREGPVTAAGRPAGAPYVVRVQARDGDAGSEGLS